MVIHGSSVEKLSSEIAWGCVFRRHAVSFALHPWSHLHGLAAQVTQLAAKGFCTIDPRLDEDMLRDAREDTTSILTARVP